MLFIDAYSIAYVECGGYDNALALKNWFDNKYVVLTVLLIRFSDT